ncbi:unnamed protein product [Clonostachys rhizophaga]|uniref:AAA+ ATPase domain-containing protein n=1 Tax=Clonostachys rhizophaga TaxID=160324 RepID=A0A9N9VG53_9HYPO|nr:unnamed protein product [Clonostachys rhizophaga]
MNLPLALPKPMMSVAEMIPPPLLIILFVYGYFRLAINGIAKTWFTSSHEASAQDPVFKYFEHILNTKVKDSQHSTVTQDFTIDAILKEGHTDTETGYTTYPRHEKRSEIRFRPSWGQHIFWENGRLFMMEVTKDKDDQYSIKGIRLYTFGFGSRGHLMDLFYETVKYVHGRADEVSMWMPAPEKGVWAQAGRMPPRHKDTLSLPGIKEEALNDANQHFKSSTAEWHRDKGVPWRRGFCFHGPPGSGKSSLVHVIASQFKLDIYRIIFTSGMTDIVLQRLCSIIPKRCILLIEDIDKSQMRQTIRGKDSKDSKGDEGISLSGLLNVIDGVCAPEGRLFIMNVNDLSEIDSSLTREGRIDQYFEFKDASPLQAAEMFQNVYKQTSLTTQIAELSRVFSDCIPDQKIPPANIQRYLLKYKEDPGKAVENAARELAFILPPALASFDQLVTEQAPCGDAQLVSEQVQLDSKLAIWAVNETWHDVIKAPDTYSTWEDLEILNKSCPEIFSMFSKGWAIIVELGTGASEKVMVLIDKCVQEKRPCYYLAVDISQTSLDIQRDELSRKYKGQGMVILRFLQASIETACEILCKLPGPRVFLSLADIILNSSDPMPLLKALHGILRKDDLLYISQDTAVEEQFREKREKYYDQDQCWKFIDEILKSRGIDTSGLHRRHIWEGRLHKFAYVKGDENTGGPEDVEIFSSFHHSRESVEEICSKEGFELVKEFGEDGFSMSKLQWFFLKPLY